MAGPMADLLYSMSENPAGDMASLKPLCNAANSLLTACPNHKPDKCMNSCTNHCGCIS